MIWRGVLRCTAGIEIHVEKVQDLRRLGGRPTVRTLLYNYHVLQRLPGGERNLLRYDNAHAHPGHPDTHHRHDYEESGYVRVRHLTECGWEPGDWPTLGNVIEEIYDWWQDQAGVPGPDAPGSN